MAALKLLNILALASVAVLTISSGPTQVNALVADRAQVARQVHGHEAIARRKRDTSSSTGRCKSKPASSLTPSSPAPAPPALPTSVPPPTTDAPAPPAPTSSAAPPPPAPTSSAAPPPPPAPAPPTGGMPGNGKKWGLGWPNGDQTWLDNFARPNVGYLYTWSPYLPSGLDALGITGIPMLWGWNQISDFQNLVVQGYAQIVLGMNEPNEPSQSNISPQDGVNMWMQYINPLQYQGYYLVSPACTNDQAGLDWYQQFFAGCQSAGCHVDAIAFHAYTTNAQDVINYATTLHNTYNLPIWITEFADENYSGSGGQASMDEVWGYAGQMVDFVNNTPWLEVAFPFGVMGDLQGVNTDNALLGANNFPTDLAYTYFG